MLETSAENNIHPSPSVPIQPIIINSTLNLPVVSSAQHFTTHITNDSHLLDDVDLLASLTNPEDGLTEDILQHVAKLVEEDKNLQEIIDKQVLGVTTTAVTMPIKDVPIISTPEPTVTVKPVEKESPFVKLALQREAQRAAAQTPISRGKEPIKIIRSDGRVITLPPIEAPTTRGAKRRAENVPTPEQQTKKSDVATPSTPKETKQKSAVAGRKLSLDVEVDRTGKLVQTSAKAKAKEIKDRRASVAVKRTSSDSNTPKRLLSTSAMAPATNFDMDDDDDEDGSDGSYNSEDDPLR